MNRWNKIFLMMTAVFILMSASCACDNDSSTAPPPSSGSGMGELDMTPMYDYVVSYQLAYIRSLQLPSGAIKDNTSNDSRICPYFAHFAVLALLTEPTQENVDVVKKYIVWYLGKLNGTKTEFRDDETDGSVYDYQAPNETTKGTYDSVDSYAATFLEILARFASLSQENKEFLASHKDRISRVADAMIKTMDTDFNDIPGGDKNDYLSIAHYRYAIKYLMDNSEVNMGLKAAIALHADGLLDVKATGTDGKPADLAALLAGNTEGILSMYNSSNGNYDYAYNTDSDWDAFYPGATAQLYPCLFGVVSPMEVQSKQLYATFNEHYPDWATGKTYATYPWTMVVYAAANLGDKERVDSYVSHIYGLNINNEQKPYWYDAEAGTLVLAIDRIRNRAADQSAN